MAWRRALPVANAGSESACRIRTAAPIGAAALQIAGITVTAVLLISTVGLGTQSALAASVTITVTTKTLSSGTRGSA
jgi:hypothetical protein